MFDEPAQTVSDTAKRGGAASSCIGGASIE
jgi:hypothetical protein